MVSNHRVGLREDCSIILSRCMHTRWKPCHYWPYGFCLCLATRQVGIQWLGIILVIISGYLITWPVHISPSICRVLAFSSFSRSPPLRPVVCMHSTYPYCKIETCFCMQTTYWRKTGFCTAYYRRTPVSHQTLVLRWLGALSSETTAAKVGVNFK